MLGVAGRLNGVAVAFVPKHNPILTACNVSLQFEFPAGKVFFVFRFSRFCRSLLFTFLSVFLPALTHTRTLIHTTHWHNTESNMRCNWRLLHWFVLTFRFFAFRFVNAAILLQNCPKKLNGTPEEGPFVLGFWLQLSLLGFSLGCWVFFSCFGLAELPEKRLSVCFRELAIRDWAHEKRNEKQTASYSYPHTHTHTPTRSPLRLSLSCFCVCIYACKASTCVWKSQIRHMCVCVRVWGLPAA